VAGPDPPVDCKIEAVIEELKIQVQFHNDNANERRLLIDTYFVGYYFFCMNNLKNSF